MSWGEVRVGCSPGSSPTQLGQCLARSQEGTALPSSAIAQCPPFPSLGPSVPISVWKCIGSVGSPGVGFPVVGVGLEGQRRVA